MQTPAHRAAIAQARATHGLNDQPSTWTYEQRTQYIKTLAGIIEANADQFPAAAVAQAVEIGANNYSPLEDASFDWGLFSDEVTANAGALNTRYSRLLSGTAAVVAVVVALYFVITTDPRRTRA